MKFRGILTPIPQYKTKGAMQPIYWNQLTSLDLQQILFALFLAAATIWAALRFYSRRKESTQTKDDVITAFPKLPDDVVSYKKTKIFDEETFPSGFRERHSTAKGVWGQLHVLSGRVRFVQLKSEEHGQNAERAMVIHRGNSPAVTPPQAPHRVEILPSNEKLQCYVEFWKKKE